MTRHLPASRRGNRAAQSENEVDSCGGMLRRQLGCGTYSWWRESMVIAHAIAANHSASCTTTAASAADRSADAGCRFTFCEHSGWTTNSSRHGTGLSERHEASREKGM